jgi:uncharacterized membrane protein YtjA (UPF0391 family)
MSERIVSAEPLFPSAVFAGNGRGVMPLLKWAIIALVLSLVAGLLGFTNLSAASAEAAKIFFYIFIALFVLLIVLGLTVFRAAKGP